MVNIIGQLLLNYIQPKNEVMLIKASRSCIQKAQCKGHTSFHRILMDCSKFHVTCYMRFLAKVNANAIGIE